MKPSIPKGTRDFSPLEMMRRNYIFDVIKNIYLRYGFEQIETPAVEMSETLMGKYGEEGDKLIFKILNSGNYIKDLPTGNFLSDLTIRKEILEHANSWKDLVVGPIVPLDHVINHHELARNIAEKSLRYDLTVPFARYVVMHQNEITFPFKRFQIQPVWRADRPQKGRYREFYQCDADIIGSNSLLNEVELIQIIDDVFSQLQIDVTIKINNRKTLFGISEAYDLKDKFNDFVVILDKIDKIGIEKVEQELKEKGMQKIELRKILIRQMIAKEIHFSGGSDMTLSDLHNIFKRTNSETGLKGLDELELVFNTVTENGLIKSSNKLEFDISLARGLNYYTGAIIEVKVNDSRSKFTSSICGGGRYDDLTGIFGLPNVSGVGISFGADRIYDVLEEIGGFPDFSNVSTKILFVNFGEEEAKYCMKLVKRLRDDGVNTELYPDAAKMKKQLSYADAKKIPYVALIGSEEMKVMDINSDSPWITIKTMSTGNQSKVTIDELLHILK